VFFYRDGDLKIIYREKENSWELYDLREDPEDVNNIFEKSTAAELMIKRLIPRITRWTSQKG